ncbi:MAG TPA: CRISPR-associated endonuclease Cas2 [Aquifex aeolicus]|nr:CRISPR-associated endonuclease Cas2 [Aquifex aeolicus]
MSKVLVCYDIKKESRRAKVRKISKKSGQHHQLSVFLIKESPVKNILQALEVFVEQEVDSL